MKKVLLYSSGLDSELYRLLEQPDILLFFKSGAKYEKREVEQLQKFQSNGLLKDQKVIIDETLNFHVIEREDAIVPMRNIFYILRALEYGQSIYLGVTYNDLHYDKQPDVIGALHSFVQSFYYFREVPETWTGPRFYISTPYRHYTKGEILEIAINEGLDVSHIPTLRTCYDEHSIKGCGGCHSCMGKAIALAHNGLYKPEYFDEDSRIVGQGWLKEYMKEAELNIQTQGLKEDLKKLLGS